MAEIYYQLEASGESLNGGIASIRSTRIYRSENIARDRIELFLDQICDERRIFGLVRATAKVKIIPLEVYESMPPSNPA